MSELIPVAQAEALRSSLLEYLGTTFSLDTGTRANLEDFLHSPRTGIFRGPYVRLRLPFEAAADSGGGHQAWLPEGFTPYGHQAAAFDRLTSLGPDGANRRPKPTLVTTGTGSGKTESFLYPILDHVLRAKRAGVTGTKALILYPMNALANDQAKRLTELITGTEALRGVTAGLYTGQDGPTRSHVTAAGLITDRKTMQSAPPDILLTNYKMLDQLLLREADARLWASSAQSLQYLVLDEFHTYDGAQGTDVAMLIRRLGLALKSYWPTDPAARTTAGITATDLARPLGRVTPVATSATLGDKSDPEQMLGFARTVFGEEFAPDAVVTESRLDVDTWAGDAAASVAERGWKPVDLDPHTATALGEDLGGWDADRVALEDAVGAPYMPPEITRAVLARIYDTGVDQEQRPPDLSGMTPDELLVLAKAHPLVRDLVDRSANAADFGVLVREVFGTSSVAGWTSTRAEQALTLVLTALSHLRKECGRAALSVDVHLWTRELTRLNRSATADARFHWEDDGVLVGSGEDSRAFPALYCRHCGRSGWGVLLAPTGTDLDSQDRDNEIRGRHLHRDDRFRALIYSPADGDLAPTQDAAATRPVENLVWFDARERRLTTKRPEGEHADEALPVLAHTLGDAGAKVSVDDQCPSCNQDDGIRFLGSAIATMLSVTLSGLFGTPGLDSAEKKALVFTDSVQDAAHRAGFVQSRSHVLTIRSVLRQAVGDGQVDLETLVSRVLDQAGDDQANRYRILPPDLAEREAFAEFWQKDRQHKVKPSVRGRARARLALDVLLEHGLRSGVGRTLEATGTVVAEVAIERPVLLQCAVSAIDDVGRVGLQGAFEGFEASEQALVAWVRGTLERMRTRGAIKHKWFDQFRRDDGNRWRIWGGRPRKDGMPGFGPGQSAPAYPRLGGSHDSKSDLEPVASERGWYAAWTAKCLNLGGDRKTGATLARALMLQLAQRDLVDQVKTASNGTTYALLPEQVVVTSAPQVDLDAGRLALVCLACGDTQHAPAHVVEQLVSGPCRVMRCGGRLTRLPVRSNFYRDMYSSTDPTRVVAREHTSMLEDKVRLGYEEAFKAIDPPANAPNVLVATPTLEMGIDIGDLSAVMLSSLPRSVASYLQRVGRAGRLTGNSLVLAFVTGRGDQLPRFGDPLTTVNGAVRAPATYLNAEEILRRQYLASVADDVARTAGLPHPRTAKDALGRSEPDSYLGTLIVRAEGGPGNEGRLDRFLSGFPELADEVAIRLRAWVEPTDAGPGSSALAARCHEASQAWQARLETLIRRRKEIENAINTDLGPKAESPAASDDDKRALRAADASLRLTGYQIGQMQGHHWVAVMEEYGLLPNYTLVDDSVTLEVAVSWTDPDSDEYVNESMELSRGSAQALRDFVPGSTFYARGYAIAIDAIDLGTGQDAIRTWACCQTCGYVVDVTDVGLPGGAAAPSTCPRCGDDAIADTGQRVETVELKRVTSVIRREEATIDDRSDERDRQAYTIWPMADIDSARVSRQWFVDGYDFGARYLRDMTIRWLNLGRRSATGATVVIGGNAGDVPMFRVCEECGKLDSATGANRASEHRPWCPLRKSVTERTRTVALSRSLTTEGLVLRLPISVTMGDPLALPSLSAALLLALRLRIGGSPDHLAVTEVSDPSPASGTADALLLHDVVPGGTGYLAELADPEQVWKMLYEAWRLLEDCECQTEEMLACEKCLLPHAAPWQVEQTSRATAVRHLKSILLGDARPAAETVVPELSPWQVTVEEKSRSIAESPIELQFREVLRGRLEQIGAVIKETAGPYGNEWQIRVQGQGLWTLDPQYFVPEAGTRPDFVLRTEVRVDGRPVPPTAIYTDGWKYHASRGHNNLADDASKRENLRLLGYNVLTFTAHDLDGAEHGERDVPWLFTGIVPHVLAMAGDTLSPGQLSLVRRSSLDVLMEWIQNPDHGARSQLAAWLPTLFAARLTASGKVDADLPLAETALGLLDGKSLGIAGTKDGGVWTSTWLAAGIRETAGGKFEIGVVLDDDPEALGDQHKADWQEWLHLSNLLGVAGGSATITTRSLVANGATETAGVQVAVGQRRSVLDGPVERRLAEALGAWAEAYEVVAEQDQPLVEALAREQDLPVPEVGDEIGDGVPVLLSWRDLHVVVDLEGMDDGDRADLIEDGWRVLPPEASVIIDALRSTTPAGRTD